MTPPPLWTSLKKHPNLGRWSPLREVADNDCLFLGFLHLFVCLFAYQVGEVADRDGSGCWVIRETTLTIPIYSLHCFLVSSIPERGSMLIFFIIF